MFLDGRREYRLTGNYADYKMVVAQVYSQVLGHPDAGQGEYPKGEGVQGVAHLCRLLLRAAPPCRLPLTITASFYLISI